VMMVELECQLLRDRDQRFPEEGDSE
jgi:hypothetical protein